MAVRYFVDDTTNKLITRTESDDLNPPSGRTAVNETTIEAAYTGTIYLQGTWDGTTYTPPTNQLTTPQSEDLQLAALHTAYITYHRDIRKQGWTSLSGAEAAALTATDRWVYHQIALGDRIVRAELMTSNTQAERDAAFEQINIWITIHGYTWYKVMLGDSTKRTLWSVGSTIGGAAIYTDLLEWTGANTGNVRTPDGTFNVYTSGTIHTNFDPEVITLRTS